VITAKTEKGISDVAFSY